jgi:serine/threonine-protein kinase
MRSSRTSTSWASPTRAAEYAISTPRYRGLGAKIFVGTALIVVVVLGGALYLTNAPANQAADQSVERALAATRSSIQDALAGRSEGLTKRLGIVLHVPTFVANLETALGKHQRSNVLDAADEFRRQSGAKWALITDNGGVLMARTDRQEQFGDSLGEGSLVGLPLGDSTVQGLWIEAADSGYHVYQAVGMPIVTPNSRAVHGVVVAAIPLDQAFADSLKARTASDIVFFALDTAGNNRVMISTLPRGTVDAGMQGLYPDSAFSDSVREKRVRWDVGGQTLVGLAGPLTTASGHPVGGYVGLRSRDAELAAFTKLKDTVKIAFGVGLVLALLSSGVIARQVTRPVQQLVGMTRQIAEGQYSGQITVKSKDEIGELAAAFQRMAAELKEKDALLEYMGQQSSEATVKLTADQLGQVKGGGAGTATLKLVTDQEGMIKVGSVFNDRYEIKEVLGVGGMGVVYRARDKELDENVAIKTLKAEAVENDATSLERFKQEIRLARRITHRNVVRTHDLGQVEGMYYITMEYVEGTNLKKTIQKRGKLPISVALTVNKQLLRALEVAHEQGVVHRDIKPQNLAVDPGGFLKVMDFGIARLAEGHKMGEQGLTGVGVAIGTPEYMAPEQLMGEIVDARADLYAAGCVMYECVTGHPVFEAPTLTALVLKHIEETPKDPRLENPAVPERMSQIILKALAKKRDERWSSAAEMLKELEGVRAEAEVAA